jgi:hypothetical protein
MERIDTVSCSFGPQFWKLGPLPGIPPHDSVFSGSTFNPDEPIAFNGTTYTWHPYHFSWRWGVENDPGHQGYHGLKEEVHDEFIRLGKMTHEWTTTERHGEEGGTYYCLFTGMVAPWMACAELSKAASSRCGADQRPAGGYDHGSVPQRRNQYSALVV